MHLDTNISVVALLSGLAGALISAFLSYLVRLKVADKERLQRQRRIAYVYFLQLTDVVASDMLLKEFGTKLRETFPLKDGVSLAHTVALYIADQLSKLPKENRRAIGSLLKPFFELVTETLDRMNLTPLQLAELPQEAVFFYSRYISKSQQFKTAVRLTTDALESEDHTLLSADILNGCVTAYEQIAEASGILRAAFITHGGISSAHSQAALARSYDIWKKEAQKALEQTSKLEAARKIWQEMGKKKQAAATEPNVTKT